MTRYVLGATALLLTVTLAACDSANPPGPHPATSTAGPAPSGSPDRSSSTTASRSPAGPPPVASSPTRVPAGTPVKPSPSTTPPPQQVRPPSGTPTGAPSPADPENPVDLQHRSTPPARG